jgi:hypothetical protein
VTDVVFLAYSGVMCAVGTSTFVASLVFKLQLV